MRRNYRLLGICSVEFFNRHSPSFCCQCIWFRMWMVTWLFLYVCLKMMHILLLSVSLKKYPLELKIDRYKDGCHLKHILGVGRSAYLYVSVSVSLSLLFWIVCVCRLNIHNASFHLYFATYEQSDPRKSNDDPLLFSSEGHAGPKCHPAVGSPD